MPIWMTVLLERLIPFKDRNAIVGDFAELYAAIAREEGRSAARLWYLIQVTRSIPGFILNGIPLNGTMLKNYLLIGLRNLRKRKSYAALNVGGLAIGMAICLLIFQYVAFETSYDTHHEAGESLFRLNLTTVRGEEELVESASFAAMAQIIRESVPEVEEVARLHPSYGSARIRTAGPAREVFKLDEVAFVDPEIVDVLSFPSVVGSVQGTLADPGRAVISERMAKRLFGDRDPVGQVIDVFAWTNGPFTIGAVMEDMPATSHLSLDVLLPLQRLLTDPDGQYRDTNGWSWSNFITYLKLRPDADRSAVAEKIDAVMRESNSSRWEGENLRTVSELQPVHEIHLYNEFADSFSSAAAYRTVGFVTVIGLFVLIIAWLNYINLSTARAMERAREVGVRKVFGARRAQVVTQFVLESMMINGVSLVLAVVIADQATPLMNAIGDVEISRSVWRSGTLWILLGACFGLGGLLASLYPSVLLSSFRPSQIFQGAGSRGAAGVRLRQSLVVFQFTLSLILLSGTYTVYRQMEHLRGAELGFDVERVLVVSRPAIREGDGYPAARAAFRQELEALASTSLVTSSSTVPGNDYDLGTIGRKEGREESDRININAFWVGDGFLDTYGFQLVAGRALSSQFESDEDATVLNETAVRRFGFEGPEEAVGKRVILGRSTPFDVVGVVRDYRWKSAKSPATPLVTLLDQDGRYFSMKVDGRRVSETLADVERLFSKHFPGNAFEYAFADEQFDTLYRAEDRLRSLVSLFAGFALLVAALGLVGLAALTSSQRRKEISVRKVLGAGNLAISRLLTSHFVVLVAVGLAISIPVTWLAADRWLSQFPSRVSLTPGTFLLPAAIVLLSALAASAFHVWRAAVSSPIGGIRSE